jgi:hypothetical protein
VVRVEVEQSVALHADEVIRGARASTRDANGLWKGVEHLHKRQWVLVVWKSEVTLMVS